MELNGSKNSKNSIKQLPNIDKAKLILIIINPRRPHKLKAINKPIIPKDLHVQKPAAPNKILLPHNQTPLRIPQVSIG